MKKLFIFIITFCVFSACKNESNDVLTYLNKNCNGSKFEVIEIKDNGLVWSLYNELDSVRIHLYRNANLLKSDFLYKSVMSKEDSISLDNLVNNTHYYYGILNEIKSYYNNTDLRSDYCDIDSLATRNRSLFVKYKCDGIINTDLFVYDKDGNNIQFSHRNITNQIKNMYVDEKINFFDTYYINELNKYSLNTEDSVEVVEE